TRFWAGAIDAHNQIHCFLTVKLGGPDGALLWEKRLEAINVLGMGASVVLDGSDNLIVTGSVWSRGPDISDSDYFTAKLSGQDGSPFWEQLRDGPADSFNFYAK